MKNNPIIKPEPFRIKMVEAISLLPFQKRKKLIEKAGYNVFQLKGEDVFIDLLTDSGTSAMSDQQWAAMLTTKQAYAGSNSFYQLEEAIKKVFGLNNILNFTQSILTKLTIGIF